MVVCHVEIAHAVKGEATWLAQSAIGKDRSDATGSELLNRVGAIVGHLQIVCTVKGKVGWLVQSTMEIATRRIAGPEMAMLEQQDAVILDCQAAMAGPDCLD